MFHMTVRYLTDMSDTTVIYLMGMFRMTVRYLTGMCGSSTLGQTGTLGDGGGEGAAAVSKMTSR